jgi:hypothetical protein
MYKRQQVTRQMKRERQTHEGESEDERQRHGRRANPLL